MSRFVAVVGVSLFLASTSSLAEVSEEARAAMNAEFQAIDQSEGVNFEIVQDKFGDARSVIGKFDVGLDSTTSFDPDAVAGAVADFISAHGAAWGQSKGFRPVLVPGDVLAVDQYFHVAAFDQYVGDLKVLDGQLTASFWGDGSLHSVNGLVANWGAVNDQPLMTDVVGSFADAGVAVDEEGTLERGISLNYGGVVWRHRSGGHTVVLDEASGAVLHTDDGSEHVTGPCNVTRRDWVRSGGVTTTLNESGNNTSEQITCEASDTFGSCNWQLRREPFGFDHGIARVLDFDPGVEQEVVQACSSGAVPQFTGTNGDSLREQGAFYVENQMRFFTDQNVWSQVGGFSSDNVRITVDNPNVTTAEFNDFFTDIDCNQNCAGFGCCDTDVLSHEYGHYVVFSYGGSFDDQCIAGTEEGNALDETLATTLGELFWMDDDQTNAQYGAMGGFALGNGPAAHLSAGTPLTAAPSCPGVGGPPNGTDGQPFQQAVWELMFNRDCTIDTCVATTGDGNTIWIGETQETVLTRVGAALGFAMSVLGTNNITHDMVRAQMRQRIIADEDAAHGTRAQRVFSHHGLNCATCCAGC